VMMISVVIKVRESIEIRVIVIGLWKTWSLIVRVRMMEYVIQGREMRQPTWIGEYVSGEGLNEEKEVEAYMVQRCCR